MSAAKAAIAGGDSPLGRELRDQLEQRGIQAELKLVGAEDELPGVIGIEQDEPIILTALDRETLLSARVLFLTGTREASARTMELVEESDAHPMIVDLSYGLEQRPD